MIYSCRCENREILLKLKELGFPQNISQFLPATYIDEKGFIVYGDYEDSVPSNLTYMPLYSEIMDWLIEEKDLSLCIFRKEDGFWFYVQSIYSGEILRSEKCDDEIQALKIGIEKALEIDEQEIGE